MPLTQFTFIKRRKSEIHIKNAVKIYLNYFRKFSPGNSLLPLFVFETEKNNKKNFEIEINVYFLLTTALGVSVTVSEQTNQPIDFQLIDIFKWIDKSFLLH